MNTSNGSARVRVKRHLCDTSDKNVETSYDNYSVPPYGNELKPPVKKPKVDKSGKNYFKSSFSIEDKTDTIKSLIRILKGGRNSKNNGKKNEKKSIENNNVENKKEKNKNKDKKNEKKNNIYKNQNCKKKNDENIDQDNVMLFNIESSNGSFKPEEVNYNEPSETTKSLSSSLLEVIQSSDELIDTSKLKKHNISKLSKINKIKPANTLNNSANQNNNNFSLKEIEFLYQKYFNKSVQSHILIIANIFNILCKLNKHHETRFDKSFKKNALAENINVSCQANLIYLNHRHVLKLKFHKYFLKTISKFDYSGLELTFKMFFISIVLVYKVLEPEYKNNDSNQVNSLLKYCLKHSELDAKVETLIMEISRSTFMDDSLDMVKLLDDSLTNDPDIIHRMSLFFLPPINSREYFQMAIDVVKCNSKEDLGLLIDNAASQFYIDYKSKNSLESSSLSVTKKNVTVEKSVTSIQTNSKSDDSLKPWVLGKTQCGTYRPKTIIPMIDEKSKDKTPSIKDFSRASSQIDNSVEDSYNPLLNSTSAITAMFESILPKGTTITSVPPVCNDSLQSRSTYKPSIQTIKSASSNFPRSEDNTIIAQNVQHDEVSSSVYQLRAVTPQNGIVNVPASPIQNLGFPMVNLCDVDNCPNAPKIQCSKCRSAIYCSKKCQQLDWYQEHMYSCIPGSIVLEDSKN